MATENRQRTDPTEQPSRVDVLVRNIDGELYTRFCERAESLGVSPDSVLEEMVDRGMMEWIRMRSK